ncbi:hypothetical protein ACLQ24_21785 [Micromonospora sp. DT4]|uniref:hypothetical protein n=1 Tax=Micromonospora sp. DT4 TaxID=3393438 RepID=UPI003CEF8C3A
MSSAVRSRPSNSRCARSRSASAGAVFSSSSSRSQGVPAGQQAHVQDIVGEIERRDLRDVVLVGHSYSGIPVG